MNSTVVLVHGAWHGAWCFERVVGLLDKANVPFVAVDLPGRGQSLRGYTDLCGDTNFVNEVLEKVDGDIILLGHSYGGAVITKAGYHPRVKHLVYLAAFALERSETCTSVTVEHSRPRLDEGRPNLASGTVHHSGGLLGINQSTLRDCLYNDCDEETVTWASKRIGLQPIVSLNQAPAQAAWRERPSTYVVCTRDMAVHPDLQVKFADRCSNQIELDASHSPFASMPERVSDILLALARR